MRSSSARLRTSMNGQSIGTAWYAGDQRWLTAFHCVGDRTTQQIKIPTPFIEIATDRQLPAELVWFDSTYDIAELKTTDMVEVAPLRIASTTNGLAQTRWFSFGFAAAHSTGLHLTGTVVSIDASVDGSIAIQLDCDQGGHGQLVGVSGAPVCISEGVIGLIRHGTISDSVLFATGIKDIVTLRPALFASADGRAGASHPLLQIPRRAISLEAPITDAIRKTFAARLKTYQQALRVLERAACIRRDVDPNDPGVRIVEMYELPDIGIVGPYDFWTDVIHEARLQSGRMLGALILAIPDEWFTGQAEIDRRQLWNYLTNPTEA